MGSSSSKAARGAARQFPTRSPGAAVSQATASRPSQPQQKTPQAETTKDEAIRADASDPDFTPGGFSERLQQMGIAQPNPTYSPSSTASPQGIDGPDAAPLGPTFPSARNNTTLSVLENRRRLQQQAEQDFENMGRANSSGRRFVDMRTLVDALQLRDRGMPPAQIERQLSLQPQLLEKLGRQGLLSHAASGR